MQKKMLRERQREVVEGFCCCFCCVQLQCKDFPVEFFVESEA